MSDLVPRLKAVLLTLVPSDGSPIGNAALRKEAEARLQADGLTMGEADYWQAHESRLDKFHGTVSLPFEAGDNRKIAVKIVDDRGIESLKVMPLM